ncbi:hypothetical protein PAHAL_2G456500 [Panicum hallii]|uniref:Uncharacterized protein n=1 Tax=Panicum hallii TaxID=206008 RepID=A0A2T8KT09_9POAL|nr:hypothetical protein PAHAL_2G456500 [Panicum hallii]
MQCLSDYQLWIHKWSLTDYIVELHVIYSMIRAQQQQGMARWRVTTGASIVCSSVYSIQKKNISFASLRS